MGLETGSPDIYVDLGLFGEQKVTINFDYQPFEHQTHDYPGCDESITITSLKWEGKEYIGYISEDHLRDIEIDLLEYNYGDEEVDG